MLRKRWLGLASLVLALVVGLAAVVDHHLKTTRIDRIELADWYCSHRGTRCGQPAWEPIERRWNERQLGYEIAVTLLVAFGAVILARSIRR